MASSFPHWPWRNASGGMFKRDPGSGFGAPDLAWVWFDGQRMGWRAMFEPAQGRAIVLDETFMTAKAAMYTVDARWPAQVVH